jgi:TraM recognition site of TraD and TraG
MTVDPMKLDNPIAYNAMPSEPLTLQFPARPVQSLDGRQPTPIAAFVFTNCFIQFAIGLAFVVLYRDANFARFMIQFDRIGVLILIVTLLVRLIVPSHTLFYGVYSVALVMGSNSFAASTAGGHSNPVLNFLFATTLLAWPVLEIGLHYGWIANKMLIRLRDKDKDFVAKEGTFLLNWTVGSLLLIHIFVNSVYHVYLLLGIALVNVFIGFDSAQKSSTTPGRLIRFAIRNFLTYPSGGRLAPGLIETVAGPMAYRVACITMPMVGLIACRLIVPSSMTQIRELVIWVLASIALTFSYVVLVAGKLVRPEMVNPSKGPWDMVVDRVRQSSNELETNSYFWGFVEADNSPIMIERSLFAQPVHFLGNSGSGKTAVGLAPTIEQTIRFGDMSVFVIDLKADTRELLATCMVARDKHKERTGIELPIRIFTLEQGDMCHAFNPFTNPGWRKLSLSDRSSIVCASLGLFYGFDYARQYYSAENADVVDECFNANPTIESFQELLDTLFDLIEDRNSYMSEKKRSSYVHVVQILSKLASCNMLNVTSNTGASQEVLDCQMNLTEAFERPGIYYFHLPSITSPILAPSVARIVAQFLIVAGRASKRPTKVQVFIDEFQRMISENLDQFFQMARSMDVRLVLANQSLSDLKASGAKLYQAIEGNCNVRQWISATSIEDLQAIEILFGEHKEVKQSVSYTSNGPVVSETLESAPRITMTDLHTIFDDPSLSVVKITGTREGYSRYRGIPFVMRSHFHISKTEYQRRRDFVWPIDLIGTMEVKETPITRKPKGNSGGSTRPGKGNSKNKGLDQPFFDPDTFS